MIYRAHKSFINYKDNFGIINDYYQNIVRLIKDILFDNPELQININLCDSYNFNKINKNKTLLININCEHTLVKRGGRSVDDGTPFGSVPEVDDTNEMYLVRIENYKNFNSSNIIIDYSNPNIHNVKTCSQYNSFSKKHIYISSSIYTPYFIKENRDIITLTTFINTNEERRAELLKNIKTQNIQHININNCFKENEMQHILQKSKILINIHQTPHHHTLEELRVLPALECGVIVISEKSPLIETIPYSDLIIWVSYDDIIEKTKEVINNYDFFNNKIFSKENIDKLCNLKKINYETLNNAILKNR